MVLLLTMGTIVLAGAVVYLVLERGDLKESVESQKLKAKAAIDYAENLAKTNDELRLNLTQKSDELLRCYNSKAANQQQAKPGRPRKK
jgi:hypothetical protein